MTLTTEQLAAIRARSGAMIGSMFSERFMVGVLAALALFLGVTAVMLRGPAFFAFPPDRSVVVTPEALR